MIKAFFLIKKKNFKINFNLLIRKLTQWVKWKKNVTIKYFKIVNKLLTIVLKILKILMIKMKKLIKNKYRHKNNKYLKYNYENKKYLIV
jgi:hypothetical protein